MFDTTLNLKKTLLTVEAPAGGGSIGLRVDGRTSRVTLYCFSRGVKVCTDFKLKFERFSDFVFLMCHSLVCSCGMVISVFLF